MAYFMAIVHLWCICVYLYNRHTLRDPTCMLPTLTCYLHVANIDVLSLVTDIDVLTLVARELLKHSCEILVKKPESVVPVWDCVSAGLVQHYGHYPTVSRMPQCH